MNHVDITGLDKAEVLIELTRMAKWHPVLSAMFPEPDERYAGDVKSAAEHLQETKGKVDYYLGCSIKTSFCTDFLDPKLYDADNGSGRMAAAVSALRLRRNIPPSSPPPSAPASSSSSSLRFTPLSLVAASVPSLAELLRRFDSDQAKQGDSASIKASTASESD